MSLAPEIDALLEASGVNLGAEHVGYRNHLYRLTEFCEMLHPCTVEEREKILIAAVFHDIGLWSAHTLDYLEPSKEEARRFLEVSGRTAWADEIAAMIEWHHKFSPVTQAASPLVEVFRRADLIDLSFGICRFGLRWRDVQVVRRKFPNAGFHAFLAKKGLRWIVTRPGRAIPIFRW